MAGARDRLLMVAIVFVAVFALGAAGCQRQAGDVAPEVVAGQPVPPSDQSGEDVEAEEEAVVPVEAPAALAELTVHFLDVGQADATVLVAPDVTVLVDTGRHDRSDVTGHLRRLGVSALDLVVVTHPHADHLGQFDRVLSELEVAEVWWSDATHTSGVFSTALAALEASDAAYEEPRAGDTTAVGSLRFDLVNPTGATGDLHDSSLAFRVSYGSSSLLFTGDAEGPTEQRMVGEHSGWLDADVYQVGHHGSNTSTTPAFLAAVSPQIAVYSAGAGNSYGHPHVEVIDRMQAAGVQVFGTDRQGSVTLTTVGDGAWTVQDHQQVASPSEPVVPTVAPDPDPPVVDGALRIGFVSVRSPVPPRGKADATVSTSPGAECDIGVIYKSGPSSARGLGSKIAEGDGMLSWTWTVGSNTTPGEWPIDVTCTAGGQTASAQTTFEVGR